MPPLSDVKKKKHWAKRKEKKKQIKALAKGVEAAPPSAPQSSAAPGPAKKPQKPPPKPPKQQRIVEIQKATMVVDRPATAAASAKVSRKGNGVLKRSWAKRKEKNLLRKAQQREQGQATKPQSSGAPSVPPVPTRTSPRLSPRLMPAALPPLLPAAPLPPPLAPSLAPAVAGAAVPRWEPPAHELLYDAAAIERRIQPLLSEVAVGIDIEWRPVFVAGKPPNPVALLQISSRSRCVLIPIRHLRRPLPPSISQLLSSPRVVKLGCGVGEDARKLLTDCGLACTPTLEIGEVATRLQREEAVSFPGLAEGETVRPGLRGLSLACGFDLEKPKKLSRSNWERRPLTDEQQRYAAYDAYAGVWIARCLHTLHNARHAAGGDANFAQWLAQQAQQLKLYAAAQGVAKAASKAAKKRGGK